MRALGTDELKTLVHDASSLDVRARGRLAVLRVALPPDVDAEHAANALADELLGTPLRGVEVIVQVDPGQARVLGGVFDTR